MKEANVYLLNKVINQKAKEQGFTITKPVNSGAVVSILREDSHLFTQMSNSLVPALLLQMTICTEEKALRMLFFPSPRIVQEDNLNQFISLSNAANRYLYRGKALGRFWVDEANLDFAYEVIIKEELLESCSKEVAKQLFDVPLAHFTDLHIPLIMLAQNKWNAETAIGYLEELREKGYVDNLEYEIW